MIRKDGKIVIQRRFNYRIKNIVLRDEEIEEIYNYQLEKINKEKGRTYRNMLLRMLELEYSKEFVKVLEKEESEAIEQLIDICIENQNAIDYVGIGTVWDLADNSICYAINKKYEKYSKDSKRLEETCLKYN